MLLAGFPNLSAWFGLSIKYGNNIPSLSVIMKLRQVNE